MRIAYERFLIKSLYLRHYRMRPAPTSRATEFIASVLGPNNIRHINISAVSDRWKWCIQCRRTKNLTPYRGGRQKLCGETGDNESSAGGGGGGGGEGEAVSVREKWRINCTPRKATRAESPCSRTREIFGDRKTLKSYI